VFVLTEGRARLVEVNYRMIGDSCEFLLADLLDEQLFEQVLRLHLGEPLPSAGASPHGHARVGLPVRRPLRPADRGARPHGSGGTGTAGLPPHAAIGERRELTGTNRDYLGVVRAVGPDREGRGPGG
jgi:hypothetical protein